MAKFYVTTPIYYVNDVPHIGTAYTTIAADVLARWHRLQGDQVFFLTGLDENSQKTVKAAKDKLGITIGRESIQRYTDNMAEKWKKIWTQLHISYDGFIRTTSQEHVKVVHEFFKKVYEKGDVYKGQYKGLYCEPCEAFYLERDLNDGKCPFHLTPPKMISEENYFFRLSKYQDSILKHIEKNPKFIQPISRRNEVIRFLKEEGAKDISISRPITEWGIPLPVDQQHIFWVWFDALVNYISGASSYWPASLHLLAKDILRFHCIIWPGMLMSAGYPLPERLFVHGFLTFNGQKISKSLGNAIDPLALSQKYGLDAVRYFLMREIPFGQDGDFNETALKARLNNELADDLGNLVSRTLAMVEQYFKGKTPEADVDGELVEKLDLAKIQKFMDRLELHHALEEIWNFIHAVNSYINDNKPWENEKRRAQILYTTLEAIRIIAILISPFMPETAERINERLNIRSGDLSEIEFGLLPSGRKVNKGKNLFTKIE